MVYKNEKTVIDIAYQLYLNYCKDNGYGTMSKEYIITQISKEHGIFYNDALDIIRKQKIDIIKNRINGNKRKL